MTAQVPLTGRERALSEKGVLISSSDLEGRVTYCNDELYDFTGYAADDIIGQKQMRLGAGGIPASVFTDLYDSLKADQAYVAILKNRCANGDHYWADVYFTPKYENGELVGIESIRTKPDAECVERAKQVYPKVLKQTAKGANRKPRVTNTWASLGLHCKLSSVVTVLFAAVFGVLGYLIPDHALTLAAGFAITLLGTWFGIWRLTSGLRKVSRESRSVINNSLATLIYTGRQDEIGQLQLTIRVLQAKLKTALGRVGDAADELVDHTRTAEQAVASTQQEIARQESEIDQIAAAIEEMTATVSEVAQNTTDASISANDTHSSVEAGARTVRQTTEQITQLSDNVQKATKVMEFLEEGSREIGDILIVIRNIAEQTNLLALNAAIEAARAGEQGRGFAVVADEVRNLAGRTQGSIADIEEKIERLQNTTHEAVETMAASAELASQSVDQTHLSQQALEQISQQVGSINDLNTMIASAAEEQSQVAKDISEKVHMISQSAESTSGHAQANLETSYEVAQLTQKLNGIIHSFAAR